MRLGILGGTFDPIHFGHLFIAEEARAHFRLDRVLFVPNGTPPHKKDYPITEARHRFAMTCLATDPNPWFECSSIERDRTGPSYAVDTLSILHARYPGAELFYIAGIDAIADILTWRRHTEVIQLAHFIAATRPGFDWEALQARLPESYLARILPLESTALNISSTEIRRRFRQNLPSRYLTPDAVLFYILEHKLYQSSAPSEDGATGTAKDLREWNK
jgi:nicotinate-nucleotide adenylyltransferase